jgi:hypothetical protein
LSSFFMRRKKSLDLLHIVSSISFVYRLLCDLILTHSFYLYCTRSHFETAALSLQDQETQFDSVIRALGLDDVLCRSTAYAHALLLRAQARCDAHRYEAALEDAQTATQVLVVHADTNMDATVPCQDIDLLSKVYRVQADAYEGLGQCQEAIQSLQMWSASDPSLNTKISHEITRLSKETVRR